MASLPARIRLTRNAVPIKFEDQNDLSFIGANNDETFENPEEEIQNYLEEDFGDYQINEDLHLGYYSISGNELGNYTAKDSKNDQIQNESIENHKNEIQNELKVDF